MINREAISVDPPVAIAVIVGAGTATVGQVTTEATVLGGIIGITITVIEPGGPVVVVQAIGAIIGIEAEAEAAIAITSEEVVEAGVEVQDPKIGSGRDQERDLILGRITVKIPSLQPNKLTCSRS